MPDSLTSPLAGLLDAPPSDFAVREAPGEHTEERRPQQQDSLESFPSATDWVLAATLDLEQARVSGANDAATGASEELANEEPEPTATDAGPATGPSVSIDEAAASTEEPESLDEEPHAAVGREPAPTDDAGAVAPCGRGLESGGEDPAIGGSISFCVMPVEEYDTTGERSTKERPDIRLDDPVRDMPNPWSGPIREELRDDIGELVGYRDTHTSGESRWYTDYDVNLNFVASGYEHTNGAWSRTVRENVTDEAGAVVAYRDVGESGDAFGNWWFSVRETFLDANGLVVGYRESSSGGLAGLDYQSSFEYDAAFGLVAASYADSSGHHYTTVRVVLTDDAGAPSGYRLETIGEYGFGGLAFSRIDVIGPDGLQQYAEYSDSSGTSYTYSLSIDRDEAGHLVGYTAVSSWTDGTLAWNSTARYDADWTYLGGDFWPSEAPALDTGESPEDTITPETGLHGDPTAPGSEAAIETGEHEQDASGDDTEPETEAPTDADASVDESSTEDNVGGETEASVDADASVDESSTEDNVEGETEAPVDADVPAAEITDDVDAEFEPQIAVCWFQPPSEVELEVSLPDTPRLIVCWEDPWLPDNVSTVEPTVEESPNQVIVALVGMGGAPGEASLDA